MTTPECSDASPCTAPGYSCASGRCVFTGECSSEADCSMGFDCVGARCTFTGECVADGECAIGYRCDAARCVPAGCTRDTDCLEDQRCSPILRRCIPRADCTSDGECNAGELCVAGACTPVPRCSAHADCPPPERCDGFRCVARVARAMATARRTSAAISRRANP